jgi:hypothetical protein
VPTVLRIAGFRFFFFSNEGQEPAHIHVESAERYAKFWLEPISLAENHGFRSAELAELRRQIEAHSAVLKERWDEFFRR